jgi:hypothetical protein
VREREEEKEAERLPAGDLVRGRDSLPAASRRKRQSAAQV